MRSTEWTELATYGSSLEADVARVSLDGLGIPVLVKGELPGGLGAGFQGTVAGGVTLYVPREAHARASRVLGLEGRHGSHGDADAGR